VRSALDSLMLESETALLRGGDSDGWRAVQCDTRHLAAHATSAGVPLSSGTSQNDSALDILELVAVSSGPTGCVLQNSDHTTYAQRVELKCSHAILSLELTTFC